MSDAQTIFENLVLSELSRAWHHQVNRFKWDKSGITAPNFRIFDGDSQLGRWKTSTREMGFSRSLITKRSWNEVLEVLKHEMAHQYVGEILKNEDETSHGPTFRAVCKQHNIDAAAKGTPGAHKLTTTNHIVEKIQNLLNKTVANGASEEEAQTAATIAHNLMLKHNIELQEKNEELGYTVRYLGGITGRIQGYMSELSNLLSKYYFVEIIWVTSYDPRSKKKGHELEISGTEDNVEVADYVYDFISRAAVGSWEKKMADPSFKLNLHKEYARSFGSGYAPQSIQGYTTSARSNFLIGFVRGFKEQLKLAEAKEQQAGLVLRKDHLLEEFYHARHPHIRSIGRSSRFYNQNMQGQGFSEGKSLKLPAAAKAGKNHVPLLGK